MRILWFYFLWLTLKMWLTNWYVKFIILSTLHFLLSYIYLLQITWVESATQRSGIYIFLRNKYNKKSLACWKYPWFYIGWLFRIPDSLHAVLCMKRFMLVIILQKRTQLSTLQGANYMCARYSDKPSYKRTILISLSACNI